MSEWRLRSKRSPSGSLLKRMRKKRRSDRGLEFVETKIAERRTKFRNARGRFIKQKLLSEQKASVASPGKKTTVTAILTVLENPANPHYVRRNILTKGALIKTEAGTARITSRPGQHGTIQAVLVNEH